MTGFRNRLLRAFALALLLLALSASAASADPGTNRGHENDGSGAVYVGAADSPDDPGDVGP